MIKYKILNYLQVTLKGSSYVLASKSVAKNPTLHFAEPSFEERVILKCVIKNGYKRD